MTLVYGHAADDIGFLVADTLLSSEFELRGHKGPVTGKFHALKIQILNGKVAVAYAGDVEKSVKVINALQAALSEEGIVDTPAKLHALYREETDKAGGKMTDCEFLMLQIIEGGKKKLSKINGDGTRQVERAYIGDAAEYRKMTALRRPYIPPPSQEVQQPDGTFVTQPLVTSKGEIEFIEIWDAIERLPHQKMSGDLGVISGNSVRVRDAKLSGEFEYLQSGMASISPAEGKSGYSLLSSNSGRRGVAIYYVAGRFGYLFVVGDSEPCRKEGAHTIQDFIKLAHDKYGSAPYSAAALPAPAAPYRFSI